MAPHSFHPGSGLAKGGLLERYAHLIDAAERSHFYHRFVSFPNRRAALPGRMARRLTAAAS